MKRIILSLILIITLVLSSVVSVQANNNLSNPPYIQIMFREFNEEVFEYSGQGGEIIVPPINIETIATNPGSELSFMLPEIPEGWQIHAWSFFYALIHLDYAGLCSVTYKEVIVARYLYSETEIENEIITHKFNDRHASGDYRWLMLPTVQVMLIPMIEKSPEDPFLSKEIIYINGDYYDGQYVQLEDIITYELTITNPNDSTLEDFMLIDELPDYLKLNIESIEVDYEESLIENYSYENTLKLNLNLSEGDTIVRLNAEVVNLPDTYIKNIAHLYGTPSDGDYEWCEDEEDYIYIPGERDLIDKDEVAVFPENVKKLNPNLIKTASYEGEYVDVDDIIEYTLTISNPNDFVLYNHTLIDELPNCLELIIESIVVDPESAIIENKSNDNIVKLLLNLPSGTTTVVFSAIVTEYSDDYVINNARLYNENNELIDEDDVKVELKPEEEIIKEIIPPTLIKTVVHDDEFVKIDDIVTYTLTINNPNDFTLYNHTVIDRLPSELELIQDSIEINPNSAMRSIDSHNNTVEVLLNLAPGNTYITFKAIVLDTNKYYIINIAHLYDEDNELVDKDDVEIELIQDEETEEVEEKEETEEEEKTPPREQRPRAPQTGDSIPINVFITLIGMILTGLLVVLNRKKIK